MTASINRNLMLLIWSVFCLIGSVTQTEAAEGQPSASGSFTATGRTHAGRDIKASGDVPLGIRVQKEIAAVMFDNHTLTIGKKEVLLDGKKRAKIRASVVAVEVVCTNHVVSVVSGF